MTTTNLADARAARARKPYWRPIMVCGIPDSPATATYPVAEVEGWHQCATAEELAPELITTRGGWSTFVFLRWLLSDWPTACWTTISSGGGRFGGQDSCYFFTAYAWAAIANRLKGSQYTEAQAQRHFKRLEQIELVRINRLGPRIRWIEPIP